MYRDEEEERRAALWRVQEEAARNVQRVRRLHRILDASIGVVGIFLLLNAYFRSTDNHWIEVLAVVAGLACLYRAVRASIW